MSPSQWEHGGSPAHDEMQADIYEALVGDQVCEIVVGDGFYRREVIIPEFPIPNSGGGVAGFADIAIRYDRIEKDDKKAWQKHVLWHLFEIKPAISSVGGLIRQCRALKLIGECNLYSHDGANKVRVSPTVRSDDPLLPILRRLWTGHIAVWNATSKHFEE
jgi:hypothetical protein